MKKIDWLILTLVVIFIVAIVLWAPEPEGKPEEKKQSRLDVIQNRINQIQAQIEAEIQSLKLTYEMEDFLEKKVRTKFMFAKGIFIVLFLSVGYLFMQNGYDWLEALTRTSTTFLFALAAASFLLISKLPDVNSVIDYAGSSIRRSIHKKYGFDSLRMVTLQEAIVAKTTEAKLLQEQLANEK